MSEAIKAALEALILECREAIEPLEDGIQPEDALAVLSEAAGRSMDLRRSLPRSGFLP